jgi:hypothetical protein
MKSSWDVTFEKPSYDILLTKGLLSGVSHEVDLPKTSDVKPPGECLIPFGGRIVFLLRRTWA